MGLAGTGDDSGGHNPFRTVGETIPALQLRQVPFIARIGCGRVPLIDRCLEPTCTAVSRLRSSRAMHAWSAWCLPTLSSPNRLA